MEICFQIEGQRISRMNSPGSVQGTVKYLTSRFELAGDEWDGTIKTAYFENQNTGKKRKQILSDDNTCEVPWEVIADSGMIKVSVAGERDGFRITTGIEQFYNGKSMCDGEPSEPPTPDQYDQMIAMATEARDIAQSIRDDAYAGKFGGNEIPEYVVSEAKRVSDAVNDHQSKNSLCFAFLTDMHCGYKHYRDGQYVVDDSAVENAGQGIKEMLKTCVLDAVVLGGDYSDGSWETDKELAMQQINTCMEMMDTGNQNAVIYMRGNHDDAPYMATKDRLNETQLFIRIGKRNLINGAVIDDGNRANYGYLDFEAQKMRLIYLDTDDKPEWNSVQVGAGENNNYLDVANISGEQLKWLANKALDFSGKSNASEWGIVIVSHRSLDSENTTYFDGTSTYDANVQNVITIINAYAANSSGTITHNGIVVDYDFSNNMKSAKLYCFVHGHDHSYNYNTLTSKSIPNIGVPNVLDGRERVSDDGQTYTKIAETENSTSFCIITVDRENNKLYADHFGAGYDRSWDWNDYADLLYTNLLPTATDENGAIYNVTGYREDYRLDSSGSTIEYAGFTATGYMPCKLGDVIYLKNVMLQPSASTASNQRISFYRSDKAHIAQTNASAAASHLAATTDTSGNIISFTVKNFSSNDLTDVAYFRLSAAYIGDDSIITANEVTE